MAYDEALQTLWENVLESIEDRTFAKLTLAKTIGNTEIKNVFMRPVEEEGNLLFECITRYKTEEQTELLSFDDALERIKAYLLNPFLNLILFTTEYDLVLKVNKKGNGSLSDKAPTFQDPSLVMQELINDKNS
ncbi:MAG: hypothetical protein H6584_04255 [Flavobacteriales bacterium]|nr:hypothetical protein [Flavobacteriales bacterium]